MKSHFTCLMQSKMTFSWRGMHELLSLNVKWSLVQHSIILIWLVITSQHWGALRMESNNMYPNESHWYYTSTSVTQPNYLKTNSKSTDSLSLGAMISLMSVWDRSFGMTGVLSRLVWWEIYSVWVICSKVYQVIKHCQYINLLINIHQYLLSKVIFISARKLCFLFSFSQNLAM